MDPPQPHAHNYSDLADTALRTVRDWSDAKRQDLLARSVPFERNLQRLGRMGDASAVTKNRSIRNQTPEDAVGALNAYVAIQDAHRGAFRAYDDNVFRPRERYEDTSAMLSAAVADPQRIQPPPLTQAERDDQFMRRNNAEQMLPINRDV